MSNTNISNDELIKQLNWREAVKRFDPAKSISDADLQTIEKALILSPSSYGLQAWRFYIVSNPAIKEELRAAAYQQPQLTDSSYVVVFAAAKNPSSETVEKHVKRISDVRGIPIENLDGLRTMILNSITRLVDNGTVNEWLKRQCYIALGVLLSAAAAIGVDACPMEGFVPDEFDRILGIEKDGFSSVVICCLGYRDEDNDPLTKTAKVRFEKDEVIKYIR